MAAQFAIGTLVPLSALLVLLPLAGAGGLFIGSSMARPLAILAVACVAGGQFAGGALGRGVRLRVAFGVAFPVGLAIPLVLVSGLEALSGHETITQLALGFMPGFVFAYGLLGAVGGTLSREGWRGTAQAGALFAAGGAVGGVILVGVVALVAGVTSAAAPMARVCGATAACCAPAAIGGWWHAKLRHAPTSQRRAEPR